MNRKLGFLLVVAAVVSALPAGVSGEPSPVPATTPPPTVAEILQRLDNPDAAIRIRARNELVQRGEVAGPPVLNALPGASPEVAYDLLMVLYLLDFKSAAGMVEQVWTKSSDTRVKLAAAMDLCRFNVDYMRYQDYIVSVAEGEAPENRLAAMQMLGYIGDARVVPVLKKIFYDSSRPDDIRQAAIWDLAHTAVPEAAEALVAMVNDNAVDWFYKEIIIAGLRRLAAEPGMAETVNELLEKGQRLPSSRRPGSATPIPGT